MTSGPRELGPSFRAAGAATVWSWYRTEDQIFANLEAAVGATVGATVGAGMRDVTAAV